MISEAEEHLPGNVGGVHRIGTAVHRPVGYWTPAVHDLLHHLDVRLAHIPRVHDFDEQGREVLDFLPGSVVAPTTMLTEGQLTSLVSWTKAFHLVVADYQHSGPWRSFPMPKSDSHHVFIGHNDIAPYNSCFSGDELSGVFDWDLAGPTTALNELAFIAWNCVPLCRPIDPSIAAARLELIAQTYGGFDPVQILLAVPPRIQAMLTGIPTAAAAGDPGMKNLMAHGEPERSQVSLADLESRVPEIRVPLKG